MLPPSYYGSLLTNEQPHHQPGASVVGCYVFTFFLAAIRSFVTSQFPGFLSRLERRKLKPSEGGLHDWWRLCPGRNC